MTIYLYKFKKFRNSTKQPTATTEKIVMNNCTLKSPCSALNPVLRLSAGDGSTLANLKSYNYVYAPDLDNRYYFINDWEYNSGLWTAYCSVDVLATYKAQIANEEKYILRAASHGDLTILDMLYPTKGKTESSITTAAATARPFAAYPGSFILGLIGKTLANGPSLGTVQYYKLNLSQMLEFCDYLNSDAFAELMKDDAAGFTKQVVKGLNNPLQYIASCYYFPFDVDVDEDGESVQPKIGFWNTSPITGGVKRLYGGYTGLTKVISGTQYYIEIPNHPQIAGAAYLKNRPYSRYTFHLEPWGDIAIDSSLLGALDTTIFYKITVDLASGYGRLDLSTDFSAGKNLGTYFAQVGVPVQLSQTTSDILGAVGSLISSVGSVAGNVAYGNIGGAIGSALNGISSIVDSITPKTTSSGVNGSLLSYINDAQPFILSEFNRIVEKDTAHKGEPVMKKYKISDMSGYVLCEDGENNIQCLDEEYNALSDFFTGGFFYE